MDNKHILLVLPIGNQLENKIKELSQCSLLGKALARSLVEWCIYLFTINKAIRFKSEDCNVVHDLVIRAYYDYLSNLPEGYNFYKTEWKKDNSLWIHFHVGIAKTPPNWSNVERFTVPSVNDRNKGGLLLYSVAGSHVFTGVETRMPFHAIQQEHLSLQMGVHPDHGIQRTYKESGCDELDGFFIQTENPEKNDEWLRTFLRWQLDSTTGETRSINEIVVGPTSMRKEKNLVKNVVHPNQLSGNNNSKKKKERKQYSIEGKVFPHPQAICDHYSLPIGQVFGRLYSKSPEWKEWRVF